VVHVSTYLRVAALGDSTTVGIGDPVPGGWRGWSRLLADALAASYDVSYCNTAVSGCTTTQLREHQLADAVAHRPDVATLLVGVNDTLRASWDAGRTRRDLLASAEALTDVGALLVTVRYHDHPSLVGLPERIRRPLSARLAAVNEAYDEVHERYGGVRLDLAGCPEILDRGCWSVDRLHPSELGHRALARAYARLLAQHGLAVAEPSLELSGGLARSWRRDAAWVVVEGGPWMGRRARDLGPLAARAVWDGARRAPGRAPGRAPARVS
jgi:lysophospholipase L1-like esterase